jgi:hypothetical protein
VTGRAEGLEIELGCDCVVTAFEVRGAALAIDVADPGARPAALRNVTPTAATGSEADGEQGDGASTQPVIGAAPLPIVAPTEASGPGAVGRDASAPVRVPQAVLPTTPVPEAGHSGPGDDGTRGAVLSELTEAIARATTQGKLRLAETPDGAAAVPPAALLADPAATNLRLRLPGEEAWLPEAPPEGVNCRDAGSFDVASWVPADLKPAEALAALQSRLAPDLDSIDEARAVELARLYVGLGFGAEARAVLSALAPRHPETALLEEMARIVDGEPVQDGILAAEAACPGRAQLWAALATGEPGDARAVVVAVGELPVALRRLLAPRVMSSLHAEGDGAAAEAVRGTIERTEGPHGAPFTLAAARIEAGRSTTPDLAEVRGLAAGGAPSADEALAVLLEVARDRGEVLDPGTLARAENRAEDLRGTELALRLEIGLIHAHVQADDFPRAAAWLSRVIAAGGAPPAGKAALAQDFFAALAARGTEEDLLVHAAGFAGGASDLVRQDPAGAAVAARLVDLGFPGLALDYLPQAPADPQTLTLAARARLLSSDAEGALALLDGADPRDAAQAQLRAEALRALGRAAETDRTAAASEGDLSRIAPEIGAGPAAEPGTARALVQASEAARQRIDALLAGAPAP